VQDESGFSTGRHEGKGQWAQGDCRGRPAKAGRGWRCSSSCKRPAWVPVNSLVSHSGARHAKCTCRSFANSPPCPWGGASIDFWDMHHTYHKVLVLTALMIRLYYTRPIPACGTLRRVGGGVVGRHRGTLCVGGVVDGGGVGGRRGRGTRTRHPRAGLKARSFSAAAAAGVLVGWAAVGGREWRW